MEVIAKVDEDTYICKVGHSELEQFFNLYYGKMGRLKIGSQVDLGAGYDYHAAIKAAIKVFQKTKDFIETNQKTIQAIMNGLSIVQKGNEKS